MRKLYFCALLPGAFALLIPGSAKIAGPVARTNAYFAFQRLWVAHWPGQNGRYLPRILQPSLQPFVPVWVQVEPHVKMLLDPQDYVSKEILETGSWESDSFAAIQRHLSSGATFVDVGAHIGYYSLKAAPIVGPNGHVVSIEPNPNTIRTLRRNIQASGASVISVQPVACSDTEATLDLFATSESNTGETSLSRANASQDRAAVTAYRVLARPLDSILKESGVTRVDAIKIDVEGAELLVLKGAQETLARYHPMLLVEVVGHQLAQMGTSPAELIRFLTSRGYTEAGKVEDNIEFVANH